MASWIFFTLLAEMMWSFASLFDKIILSKGHIRNPLVFIVFNGAMNILAVFLIPFFDFGYLSPKNMLIALSSGIFLTIGVIFYYKAVQSEEISRVLMMWQLVPIFVLAISFLFLGEALTQNHFIGFAFLIAAGMIISYRKTGGRPRISNAFYLMLGSAFFMAVFLAMSKHTYEATGFWSAFMWLRAGAFSGLLALLAPSVRKELIRTVKNMKRGTIPLVGFKMIIDFSAFIILGYAILNGPVSLVSALGSATAPIFIFFITLFTSAYLPQLVKENIDKTAILAKAAAILLIITGTVFVNL